MTPASATADGAGSDASAADVAAYRVDGQPVDRATFYRVACDPARSCVVEACAGAGKTWMLVSRILRALLDGAAPHEILAITFTRKAAGEMRERLDAWLAEFGVPGAPHALRVRALCERGLARAEAERLAPRLAGLQEAVLVGGRSVEIRTFHGWFSQLLRAAPLELLDELGLQPDVELVEALDDHLPAVFRRFHAALLRDPARLDDHRTLVAERGRSQTRKWLQAALAQRVEIELADRAGVLATSVPPTLDGSVQEAVVHPAHPLLGDRWRAAMRELALALGLGSATAQDAATGLVMAITQTDPRAAFAHAWRALFTDKGTPRKKLGKAEGIGAMQDELAAVDRAIRQHAAHLEHARMVRLSRLLLAEFAAYKRAANLADMQDLEVCGLALLRDAALSGWVQERLDARIRHVLIDEFQDTSPLQWHALSAWWSAYAGAGGGASGQRPPGVFIVGDPKQSIYRFRRAEPKVFEAAQRFVVEALAGRVLACDHTRRNAPSVLAALNAVFGQAVAAGEYTGFRPHTTEVEAALGDRVRALPRVGRDEMIPKPFRAERVWRDTLTVPRLVEDSVLREREAAWVADAVRTLVVVEHVAAADIMILSRKRESLRLVADALRQRHIACAAVEDFELMVAPEARDLVALLDVLASPGHRLSLAQTLRSPLFGASEDDLMYLARTAVHDDWWRALLAPDLPTAALQRAAHWLREWHAAAFRLPPHDLLDRIVHQGELRQRVGATVPPEQRLAALEAIDAVLGQALTLDGARYATPYNFVRALKRRLVRIAAPGRAEAVQLLTVHGAKGLEARVVFVMDADPQARNAETTSLLIDWPVDSEAPRRCAFLYSESACPPSLEAALADELVARQREELNGLYVAMTRAREQLVFSATEPLKGVESPWWRRVEPLAAPWRPEGHRAVPSAAAAPWLLQATLPLPPRPVRPPLPGAEPTQHDVDPAADAPARRLGRAVHRLLEWATGPGSAAPAAADADADATVAAGQGAIDLAALARAAASEFAAPPSDVLRLGRAILTSADCARFFYGPSLRWAGNEVPVSEAGEVLRIDRLVCLDDAAAGPVWWVLDYKLAHAPAELAEYRAQLRRYRHAVQQAQGQAAAVRSAFVTGAGEVVEID